MKFVPNVPSVLTPAIWGCSQQLPLTAPSPVNTPISCYSGRKTGLSPGSFQPKGTCIPHPEMDNCAALLLCVELDLRWKVLVTAKGPMAWPLTAAAWICSESQSHCKQAQEHSQEAGACILLLVSRAL